MDDAVERALAEARALGFLGPGPLTAHEASAQAFLDTLGRLAPEATRLLDLGSGGGVPGLLLAAALPATSWIFVDVHRRRTSFLARTAARPPWAGRVTVVRGAAEVLAHDPRHRESVDVVVSRSFGPPATTAECAIGFLRPGGRLLVAEPPQPDTERWPADALAQLGLEIEDAGGPVVSLRRHGALDAEVPRAWRELERRPRWSAGFT
jgi:16S rRNA (guanine527-N7)-methyltransferase